MIVGFDASRAQVPERAGPENYTYNLLRELLRVDQKNFYRLYYNPRASNQYASLGFDFRQKQLLPFDSQPRTTARLASCPTSPASELAGGRARFEAGGSNFELRTITWPKLWTQGGLALECLKNPPDVLFIPAHTIPLVRRPNLKTVVTIHDVGFQKFLEQYQRRWWRLYGGRISNFAARAATHVIAVSESTKKDLIEKLAVSPDKITVVYEGVDHTKFKVQSLPAGKAGSEFKVNDVKKKHSIDGEYLLFVGTIQPRKNLVRLIEAFSTLSPKFPNLDLVLAGKKGWLAEEIYAAPGKFGVGERVKFLGYVPTEEIVSLMRGARALTFPSLYEGFGLPVLEAMACGCPVVASNISSLPEVVGDGGILVDPYNTEGIERGITQILKFNETQRQNLIEKGLKRAQKFTWQKTARETIEVLEQVVNSRS